jgi:hypothetical protein
VRRAFVAISRASCRAEGGRRVDQRATSVASAYYVVAHACSTLRPPTSHETGPYWVPPKARGAPRVVGAAVRYHQFSGVTPSFGS